MDQEPHIPFPAISRFPKEPPLPGVPRSPEDSIFLTQYPGYNFASSSLIDFENSTSNQQRRSLALKITNQLLTHPDQIQPVYEAFPVIEMTNPERHSGPIVGLKNAIEESIPHSIKSLEHLPNEKQLGKLLELAAHNPSLEPLAKKILRAVIKQTDSQGEIVSLAYDMHFFALESEDPQVGKLVAQIWSLLTELLTPEDIQAASFLSSCISPDDKTLGRYLDVDDSLHLLEMMHLTDDDRKNSRRASRAIIQGREFIKYQKIAIIKDRPRIEALIAFNDKRQQLDPFTGIKHPHEVTDVINAPTFPEILITQGRKLRNLYNQRLSRYLMEKGLSEQPIIQITLPGGQTKAITIAEGDINEALLDIFSTAFQEGPGGILATPESISSALTYLKPPQLETVTYQQLDQLNQELRNKLWQEAIYTVSPSGDLILVDNDMLKNIGLSSILYELASDGGIKVKLTLGKYQLPLIMNRFFDLKQIDGKKLTVDPHTKTWWESIIFSYLRALTCQPDIVIPKSIKGDTGENLTEGIHQFTSRRGHRMKLPPGESFTMNQYRIVLSELFIDLIEYNFDRHLDRRTGSYTWVLPVDRVKIGQPRRPLVCRIPKATEAIENILSETSLSIATS